MAISACCRCGTCCEKGGPALHEEDRELVKSGRIPLADLYTIRKGEMARDNVRGTLEPLAAEIIKIKSLQGGKKAWTCRYYNDPDNACRIYSHRPLECRALQCWDTREIERVYSVGRLQRKDLIGQVEGLWDLIADHERRCSYENLHRLALRLKSDGSSVDAEKILEFIQYDSELRHLVIDRGSQDPEMLDFLFGRSLVRTVAQFGIRVEREKGKINRLVIKGSVGAGDGKRSTKNR
jgi:Fe-S-cluster containining protein